MKTHMLRTHISEGSELSALIKQAYEAGNSINLSGCAFGASRSGPRSDAVPGYYRFLAGLCEINKVSRVLEIGTFKGGSALAIHRGIEAHLSDSGEANQARVLTIDVEDRGTDAIAGIPSIHKLIGDPLSPETLENILDFFEYDEIDLLFLDSVKKGRIVLAQMAAFSMFLNPKYIVLDDIMLNDGMETMWNKLAKKFNRYAVNAPQIVPQVRVCGEINPACKRHPGFGVIAYRDYETGLFREIGG